MQALIVHDDPLETRRFGRAMLQRGFLVAACGELAKARAFVRQGTTDLLILKHMLANRDTTAVALAAEHYNPKAATILLTARQRTQAIELFDLIPSLQAILGPDADAKLTADVAIQAVRNPSGRVLILSPQSRTSLPAVA